MLAEPVSPETLLYVYRSPFPSVSLCVPLCAYGIVSTSYMETSHIRLWFPLPVSYVLNHLFQGPVVNLVIAILVCEFQRAQPLTAYILALVLV